MKLSKLLFIDIETAGIQPSYELLSPPYQLLWNKKARSFVRKNEEQTTEEIQNLFASKAAIFAEFGKIICISVGFVFEDEAEDSQFRVKSFYGHDEITILEDFTNLLDNYYDKPKKNGIVGHNIKEFDVPYICRRLTVHQMPIPKILDIMGKKPWEINHLIDTLHLWRFGDYKNYTSLNLLAQLLDIPSPKDDIDGSQVHHVYWEEKDLNRIVQYCEKDVLTVAKLYLKMIRSSIELPNKYYSSTHFYSEEEE